MQIKSHKLTTSNFYIILILCFILLPILALFNRYIFYELNVFFLLIFLCLYTIYNNTKFSIKLFIGSPALYFFAFVVYVLSRYQTGKSLDENLQLLSLLSYFIFFLVASILFYKKKYISDLVWFVCTMYLIAYIARISLDIEAAINGTNLSSGIVVISFIPFVLLNLQKYTSKYYTTSFLIIFFLIIWCSIIGSRAATLGLMLFLITFTLWPLITKNRVIYIGYFLSCVLFFLTGCLLYIFFVTDANFSLFSDSGIGILTKRIGTRLDIWVHLVQIIINGDWVLGNGSNLNTKSVTPLSYLDFEMNRKNLSSHSLILESIYRIGVVGLGLFFLFILSLWNYMWKSRECNVTRIVCSSIIMLVPICYTSTFLIFSTFHLRCAFFWIIFGFGYGFATYYNKNYNSKLS